MRGADQCELSMRAAAVARRKRLALDAGHLVITGHAAAVRAVRNAIDSKPRHFLTWLVHRHGSPPPAGLARAVGSSIAMVTVASERVVGRVAARPAALALLVEDALK